MRITTTRNQVEAQLLEDIQASGVFKNFRFGKLSRVYTFIRAIANAIFLFIDQSLIDLQKAIHPHTATEEDLHEWLKRYGLAWKQSRPARHLVRIGSTEEVFFPIEIPQGFVISTDGLERNRIKFQTLESVILPARVPTDSRGFYTIPVLVECLMHGEIGNVVKDSITLTDDFIDGIDIVYNPDLTPIVNGVDRESIAEVRSRLKNAEGAILSKFTPDWYTSLVEQHPNVARAIFKSSRDIGLPGAVHIFVLGRAGNLSPTELSDLKALLESDTNNPGGAAKAFLFNFTTISVNKTIKVYFPDLQSIPEQSVLDGVADRFFVSLGEADDVLDASIRALFFSAIPNVVNVAIEPLGDISVGSNEVAIAGSGWSVIGEVWVF